MYDVVIIGGGPAGLSAALGAKKKGCSNILIIERSEKLGGILNQCIHNGFGLHTFKEELTGPEYAYRYIKMVEKEEIPFLLNTTVLSISPHSVTYINEEEGVRTIETKAIVLAMGCRERPRGALNIPGDRPSGIFSAGTAQYLTNIEGKMPGKRVVILGSGDIGLIMARRMTLEGAKVLAVVELMPYSSGLKRNIVQCLDDFSIPLLLSHTVTKIQGRKRVERITVSAVDEKRKPIPGTEITYDADTLLLSVGLLPENELSRKAGITLSPVTGGPIVDNSFQTDSDGIFACGNVLHVHDLVDYVSNEAEKAGESAALYALSDRKPSKKKIPVSVFGLARYTVPEMIDEDTKEDTTIRFRVSNVKKDGKITVRVNGEEVISKKKRIMAPGEMETLIIPKRILEKYEIIESIEVGTED
ncbi:MAG: NAD(P)/FAD-dependent oxidoreductase [Erysipelotrichaceae bacterium]|nr:NAD(P)/FAD-dependent oxidoreductase [Erysipelotrichaceae bacterium]